MEGEYLRNPGVEKRSGDIGVAVCGALGAEAERTTEEGML